LRNGIGVVGWHDARTTCDWKFKFVSHLVSSNDLDA
jgi:hypothetical protein